METSFSQGGPGSLRGDDATYSGYRRPGIRLAEPFDQGLSAVTLNNYRPFARGLQWFDKAQLVMLAEEGIIPREGAVASLRALLEMDQRGVEQVREELSNPLHGGEIYLIRKLGMEVGGLIHAGRSSWDLGRVGHRVRLREEILRAMEKLNDYRAVILAKAAEHVDTVMPYYTHGQQAQPTTFGHHLHAFACVAERDFERLGLAYAHMNVSPAGCAAGTTSRFGNNRERVSELIGFDVVSTNSRDSSYNYDHFWEMGSALAFVATSLGVLGDELILWMGNEFNLVQIADRYCTTSSIMTQKRNPTAAEHMQAIRTRVAGRTPTSYGPHELVQASGDVCHALQLATGVIATLKVNVDLMRERAARSWGQASDLAAVLVEERHLSWRMAHQIVGIMVRLAEEAGIRPGSASPELLDRAAVLFLGEPLGLSAETMARAMDPVDCVARRKVTGSPNPGEMARQVATSQERLARDAAALEDRQGQLAAAERKLAEAIRVLVEGGDR